MERRSHNNRTNTDIARGTHQTCAKSQVKVQRIESLVIATLLPNELSNRDYHRIKSKNYTNSPTFRCLCGTFRPIPIYFLLCMGL
jgi:hypothetical protein